MSTTKSSAKKSSAKKSTPKKSAAKKGPSKNGTPPSVAGQAMLVNVRIHMWTARRYDKNVSLQTNQDHKADENAGRYNKRLFGGRPKELVALGRAYGRLRDVHREQTLAWSDEGWRILPTANYFEYTAKIRELIEEFDAAVATFVAEYDRLCAEAQDKLGDMYNADDYPAVETVRRKYAAHIEYAPLPLGGDLRIDLPKEEAARAAKEIDDRLQASVKDAVAEAWERLRTAVSRLHERIDGDAKGLRESVVANVRDTAELLSRLNVTGDKELERVRETTLRDLGTLDVTGLRKDDAVREDAFAKADAILKDVAAVFGGKA